MYSERLLELFHNREHAGRLEEATHYGEAGTPGQGPYSRLWLRVKDGVVEAASYQTYGCPAMIACMEALSRQAVGGQAGGKLTPARIEDWVGGVPEGKEHCSRLAARAWGAATGPTQEPGSGFSEFRGRGDTER